MTVYIYNTYIYVCIYIYTYVYTYFTYETWQHGIQEFVGSKARWNKIETTKGNGSQAPDVPGCWSASFGPGTVQVHWTWNITRHNWVKDHQRFHGKISPLVFRGVTMEIQMEFQSVGESEREWEREGKAAFQWRHIEVTTKTRTDIWGMHMDQHGIQDDLHVYIIYGTHTSHIYQHDEFIFWLNWGNSPPWNHLWSTPIHCTCGRGTIGSGTCPGTWQDFSQGA